MRDGTWAQVYLAEHKRKKHGTTEAGKKNAHNIFKQIAKNEVGAMWAHGTLGSHWQKGNSPLTCSSPQPFTGFSQGRLALYPGGFLSDPDRHSLHDTHTLPYVSGGPWSGENSMSLPHGRILLKIWGQIISWPFHWAKEFSAFRRLRLDRDNTRASLAPTTMLASMSTEQQDITAGEGQEASGKSLWGTSALGSLKAAGGAGTL